MDITLFKNKATSVIKSKSPLGVSKSSRHSDGIRFSGLRGRDKWVAVSLTKPGWFSRLLSPCLKMNVIIDQKTNDPKTIWVNKESFKKLLGSDEQSASFLASQMPELQKELQSLYKDLHIQATDPDLQWNVLTENNERVVKIEEVIQRYSPGSDLSYAQIEEFCSYADEQAKIKPGEVKKIFSCFGSEKSDGRSILIGPNGEKILLLTHSENGGDRRLGQGGYKEIKLAVNLDTAEIKAVAIAKNRVGSSVKSEDQIEILRNEATMMNLAREIPEMVKIDFSFHQILGDKDQWEFYIVMDLCEDGDLDKIKENISEEIQTNSILDIASGLSALHQAGILHRDVKLANIFLKDGHAKIGDFGCSCKVGDTEDAGSPLYKAPEIYRKLFISRGSPLISITSKETDSWAFGCLMYELYTKERFFSGGYFVVLKKNLTQLDIKEKINGTNLTPQLKDLLNRLLTIDPLERCNMATAKKELTEILAPIKRRYQKLRAKALLAS